MKKIEKKIIIIIIIIIIVFLISRYNKINFIMHISISKQTTVHYKFITIFFEITCSSSFVASCPGQ